MALDPIEAGVFVDEIGGRGVAELAVHDDFFELGIERVDSPENGPKTAPPNIERCVAQSPKSAQSARRRH
jgi:hypothetical protein